MENRTWTACRLEAADASVTVVTDIEGVTDWVTRYFTPWWDVSVSPFAPDRSLSSGERGADGSTYPQGESMTVHAAVRSDSYEEWARQVLATPGVETEYVNHRTLSCRLEDGSILVVTPEERLAYRVTPGQVEIAGHRSADLAVPAARVARAVVWGTLERAGWTLLHASALVGEEQAVLSFGRKGAGKTTTALVGGRWLGLQLLANDRVFARAEGDRVRLVTWASVTSVGLGLLDGLGLYDEIRERLLDGEAFHPAQDPLVLKALHAGTRHAVFDAEGREMKVLVAPDRLSAWLGVKPVGSAELGLILFPSVALGAAPVVGSGTYRIGLADMFTERTEDSYPDVFGVRRPPAGGYQTHRDALLGALALYPSRAVCLGYAPEANAAVLGEALAGIRCGACPR
ncbi:hypothetical protein ACWEWX_40715 [Streptomyces asiaticus]